MVTKHIPSKTKDELIVDLQSRLDEAEQTLNAIQNGDIDAIVTPQGSDGPKVYTLESADSLYRNLIQEMNEGVATLTYDGTIFYSNAQLAGMLKIPLDNIIGLKFKDFIFPDDLKTYNAIFDKGLKDKSKDEINIIAADGTIIPVYISINNLKDLNGVYIVITDLSEQKLHEDLKETLKKYGQLNRTLVALRHSSFAMMHAIDENSYLDDVCKIIVDDCGYSMVWIGFTEPED